MAHWLDRELRYHVLQWRAVSPRILFVIAVSPAQAVFVFLTAHAPTSAAPPNARLAFWTLLTSVALDLDTRFPAAFWHCSVDANGRTGSVLSTAIGQNEPDQENENGMN